MEHSKDGWPNKFHLFHTARDYLDIAGGVGWLVMDRISQLVGMQHPTPSEHHFEANHPELTGVQKKAQEGFIGKMDLQDATPETALEATMREEDYEQQWRNL